MAKRKSRKAARIVTNSRSSSVIVAMLFPLWSVEVAASRHTPSTVPCRLLMFQALHCTIRVTGRITAESSPLRSPEAGSRSASSPATACCTWEEAILAYRFVMRRSRCPSWLAITSNSVPPWRSHVANVCLRSWSLMSEIPRISQTRWKAMLTASGVTSGKSTSSGPPWGMDASTF